MQGTETGIGRALRRAREHRGKSLEQASRDTRVRADYLEALEREWFEPLGSDVYVRGFLKSYSRYLGLNQDKVLAAYERAYRKAKPAPSPVERAPTVTPPEAVVLTEKKAPNWILAGLAAVLVFAAAWAIGVIGPTDAVPDPAGLGAPPSVAAQDEIVQVGVEAKRPCDFTAVVDGEEQSVSLDEGESRSFQGTHTIHLTACEGGAFTLVVNGSDVKAAGEPGAPYEATFTPQSFRGSTSPSETSGP